MRALRRRFRRPRPTYSPAAGHSLLLFHGSPDRPGDPELPGQRRLSDCRFRQTPEIPAAHGCLFHHNGGMAKGPWWTPTEDDLAWDRPLPKVVRFTADYGAELPLWGDGYGNISWQATKLPPALLDRLAAWQDRFDANYDYECGWKSDGLEREWVAEGSVLLADLRNELAGRGVEVTAPKRLDPSAATSDRPDT